MSSYQPWSFWLTHSQGPHPAECTQRSSLLPCTQAVLEELAGSTDLAEVWHQRTPFCSSLAWKHSSHYLSHGWDMERGEKMEVALTVIMPRVFVVLLGFVTRLISIRVIWPISVGARELSLIIIVGLLVLRSFTSKAISEAIFLIVIFVLSIHSYWILTSFI